MVHSHSILFSQKLPSRSSCSWLALFRGIHGVDDGSGEEPGAGDRRHCYIGSFIVAASAREGHPTAVLVRDATPANAAKAAVLQGFRDAGVTLVKVALFFTLEHGVILVRNDSTNEDKKIHLYFS